jgi:hypothetical protein
LLRDELGASPAPQTESLFLEILRTGTPGEPGLPQRQ